MEGLVRACTRCPLCRLGRTQTVFGSGNRQAALMFIGEGPGEDEDRQGLPFVGVAGQLLTKMIVAMGFTREDVYIANIVKCRPPGNRNPEPLEATACRPYLDRQIALVQPQVLVLLGAVPLQCLLERTGIMKHRGQWLKYGDLDVMPTFHPAYLTRKPEAKREVWQDLQQVMARFGKSPPPRPGAAASR
jgi:DNA polymerase